MLSFTHLVSGGQVARELANDDEEFAEMLKEICGYEASQFEVVRDFLNEVEADEIAVFLHRLADLLSNSERKDG